LGLLSVAVSPEGRLLASTSYDNTIQLWSLPDGALLKTLKEDEEAWSVAISPDGRLLASSGRFGTIKLWSLPDGAALKTLTGGTAAVYSVAISPDGKLLASGGGDRTIRLWSLPEGQPLPTCLMDVDASSTDARGIQYTRGGASYTQSCGSPVPADAVCTCNCVPGKQRACPAHVSCSCVGHSGGGSGGGSHYWHPN
jgi:WD40 repeat protein